MRRSHRLVGFKIASEITMKKHEIGRGTIQLQLRVAEERVPQVPKVHTAPPAQESEVDTLRLLRADLRQR
jgi:hypothetical protein